jgi:hypothetical protein
MVRLLSTLAEATVEVIWTFPVVTLVATRRRYYYGATKTGLWLGRLVTGLVRYAVGLSDQL